MSRAMNRRARDETYRRLGDTGRLTVKGLSAPIAAVVLIASADRDVDRGGLVVRVDRSTARVRVAELEAGGAAPDATITAIDLDDGRRFVADEEAGSWRMSADEIVIPLRAVRS